MISFRADRRTLYYLIRVLVVLSLIWLPLPAAVAQSELTPDPSPTPQPEPVVYIVQSGDTLYAIATQFGISVELLAAANNIDNPNRLTIGQRLLIPPQPAAPAPRLMHTVSPAETLRALSLAYDLSAREIALSNHLVRADQLLVGQQLTIPLRSAPPDPLYGRSHTLRNNDTLLGIAVEQNLAPWALAQVNRLRSPLYIPPDTRLWIPGDEGDNAYLDWPELFAAINLSPIPAVPGETFSIHLNLTAPISVTGTLLGNPLTFFPDGDAHVALTGISALAEPVAPTLVITATGPTGEPVHYAQPLPVAAGDYGFQTITVPAEIAVQMTAEVVAGEDQLMADLFSARAPLRRWDGLFALPTAGDITSSFGTRRTYNAPMTSGYHTGTDFGRIVGTPVYAPADGAVVYTGTLTVRGNVIVLDHGWGVMTGYWHLSAIHVNAGDVVEQGQHIGDIGNTGLSTGPHLHWEMRVNGVPVNGLQWVRERFP